MKIVDTDQDVKCSDPDELEARGDELIAEGHTLRAKAHRLRYATKAARTKPEFGAWVALTKPNDAAVRKEFGFGVRTALDAGKRGELTLHRAGKSSRSRPRVLREELERWIRSNPVEPRVVPEPGESAESVYARAAGGTK